MNEQEKYDWMVYVSCMTFNQAQYIEDAMNGFTMQETNFPFVCAVVDDASTDGEQEVIKSYLNEYFDLEDKNVVRQEETDDYVLTFARHKTNKNCYFAVLYLKYNHYSIKKPRPYLAQWREKAKYIAICEGDDFWIEPRKLQKQVIFLNNHPDYVMVHTDYSAVDSKGYVLEQSYSKHLDIPETIVTNRLFKGYYIRTLTICYRNIPNLFDVKLPQGAFRGDKFLFYMLSARGRVKYMNSITGVYRILSESASHSKDLSIYKKFSRSVYILDYFMADYFNISGEVRDQLDYYWLNKAIVTDNHELAMRIQNPTRLTDNKIKKLLYRCLKNKFFFELMFFRFNTILTIKRIISSCIKPFKKKKRLK